MRKTLTFLAILTLAVCIGVAGIAFAFASAPTVSISADIYYGNYVSERPDLEGEATIAFGEFTNVEGEEYGVVVYTYEDDWLGTPTALKYYAKNNNEGKFGVAVYGLTDGFYGLKAYVCDTEVKSYTYSDEVRIALGYNTVTLVRDEADDIVKYVKTGTAFAAPNVSGVDGWCTLEGDDNYTPYDFDTIVDEDITLYAETLDFALSNEEPIVLFTDTSMSGETFEDAREVELPKVTVTSSLRGNWEIDADWQKVSGNPDITVADGKVSATGKLSGAVVLQADGYELDVTVKSPVLGAKDLDELALVTFYGDVVAVSEYYGHTTKYLAGHYELINDIDYATYERENDTFVQQTDITGLDKVGYMLPIATFESQEVDLRMTEYADTVRNGLGSGRTSSYSKTWLALLGDYLEEKVEDHIHTSGLGANTEYKKYSLKIKAGVSRDGEGNIINTQSHFYGINPLRREFTGVLDGASHKISNAWLMLDNYLVKVTNTSTGLNSSEYSMVTGQAMHFIGHNSGTVENLIFDNLGMGSQLDYYGYNAYHEIKDNSQESINANLSRTALALLGYTGYSDKRYLGLVNATTAGDATIRKYYDASSYDNLIHSTVPVQMIAVGAWGNGGSNIVATSLGTALIGMNKGIINNVVMNYRSSGSNYNGSSGQPTDANGLCWINESEGNVSNVIINRIGRTKRLNYNLTIEEQTGACTQRLGAVVNNGSFTNTYIFCTQATQATALKGSGTYSVSILADGAGEIATNDIAVSAMDTTNCNDFIKQYVLGLQG